MVLQFSHMQILLPDAVTFPTMAALAFSLSVLSLCLLSFCLCRESALALSVGWLVFLLFFLLVLFLFTRSASSDVRIMGKTLGRRWPKNQLVR